MRAGAWAAACVIGLALASTGLACGSGGGAKFAQVKSGAMPANETWVGVYYNPVYGYLHINEQDGAIVGRWKRTDASHWGELSGTVEGNVFRFKWTEHKYGAIGPSADSHGTGVFAYKMGQNNIAELGGQYALDESDSVGDWNCIKQVGMKADVNSINGDNPDTVPVAHDKWQ
jgi:hypothetical protein